MTRKLYINGDALHGRLQAWARRGTCLPLENVQGWIPFNYKILVRTKSNKIVPQDTFCQLRI